MRESPPQQQERQEQGDPQTQERVSDMQVVEPEDIQTQQSMWPEEKVASPEREWGNDSPSSRNESEDRAV